MKIIFMLCAILAVTSVLLTGCYVYPGGGVGVGVSVEQSAPTVVIYPESYTVAPVCCNIWFGGRWHSSQSHWNHGYSRGWHHRH